MLVNRACTFLIVACVGACFAQAAAALDLKTVTPPPPKPQQKPDWAGFYFKEQFRQRRSSLDDARALDRLFLADGARRVQPAKPSATISSPAISSSVWKARWRRRTSTASSRLLSCRRRRRRLDAEHELARHRDRPIRLFVRPVAALCQRRLRRGRRRLAAAGRRPDRRLHARHATGGWTAGVGFEYQFSPKWSLGLEYLYTDLSSGAPNGAPARSAAPIPARRKCTRPP